ncbi:MAG: T9SS type A sorting domain-containing protein [Flavobacteriales bacterium]
MRKILLVLTGFALSALGAKAQIQSVTVEPFFTDNGTVVGYPAGYTTYRIYAEMTNSNDVISTVFGSEDAPLVLQVPGGIWNSDFGGTTGAENNCVLYSGATAAVQYDSYLTINRSCDETFPNNSILVVEQTTNPWATSAFQGNNNITSIVLNDAVGGAWVSPPGQPNTFADGSNRILVAQITTNSSVCGIFSFQVFPNYTGVGTQSITQNFSFGSVDCGIPGCIDPTALNYDPAATFDNHLCVYDCALNWSGLTVTPPTCGGATDGSIQFTGTGAQGFVRHTFNGSGNSLNAQNITGLGNGTYTLQISDTRFENPLVNDGGNLTCVRDTVIELFTAPLAFTATTSSNVSCSGLLDGSASAEVSGGTGAVSIGIFTNTNQPVLDGNGVAVELTSPSYSNFGAGTYRWVATDENGCSLTSPNFTITSPFALNLIAGAQLAASCPDSEDGVQVINWSGGTGDIDFSLENDGIYDIEGNANNAVFNLAPGTYTVYGADANGCQDNVEITVAGPDAFVISADVTLPSCVGTGDGSFTLSTTGGNGGYTYSVDGSEASIVVTYGPFMAGTHEVTVFDLQGCSSSTQVVVSDPVAVSANTSSDDISCNGQVDGTITIEGIGGNGTYTYSINGVDTQNNGNFSGLAVGTYDVYVTDGNGCEFSALQSVTIEEPAVLEAGVVLANVSCNGAGDGSVTVVGSGGTADYTYSIGGPFSTNATFNGLAAGNYTAQVMDANGCMASADVTITQPSVISVTGLIADMINDTPGGSSTYTVSGGTSPYTYEWTLGNTVVSTSAQLTGVTTAGTYVLTITDSNGCEYTQELIITGINEIVSTFGVTLNPNPTSGEFIMNITGLQGEKLSYSIVDTQGRVVAKKELGNNNGNRTEFVNVSDIAAGIYYVNVLVGETNQTLKLIKQ